MATQSRENFDFEEQRVRIVRAIEEVENLSAESRKFNAEQLKLMAEEAKLRRDTAFLPLIATAALLGAGAAIAKLFFP